MKSKEQWEKSFIENFILYRDYFLEQPPFSIVGHQKSKSISDTLIGYFCERRNRVPIKDPSPFMSCEDMAIYLNDCVLDYIYYEYMDFMEIDWRQRYVLKSSIDNFSIEDEEF